MCQAAKKAKTAKPDNGEEDLASLHAAAELLDDMLKARRLRPAAATFAHAVSVLQERCCVMR